MVKRIYAAVWFSRHGRIYKNGAGMNHAVITCLRMEITKCGKERIITDINMITGGNYESRSEKVRGMERIIADHVI